MSKNAAMAEAAQMAEENMDLFRRALRQKAAKRQAAAEARPSEVDRRDVAAIPPEPATRNGG